MILTWHLKYCSRNLVFRHSNLYNYTALISVVILIHLGNFMFRICFKDNIVSRLGNCVAFICYPLLLKTHWNIFLLKATVTHANLCRNGIARSMNKSNRRCVVSRGVAKPLWPVFPKMRVQIVLESTVFLLMLAV